MEKKHLPPHLEETLVGTLKPSGSSSSTSSTSLPNSPFQSLVGAKPPPPLTPSGAIGSTKNSRCFSMDEEEICSVSKEQELLVNIQELQRQLSMVQLDNASEATNGIPSSSSSLHHQSSNSQFLTTPYIDPAAIVDEGHRLIVVSNRLPISITKDKKKDKQHHKESNEYCFKMSSGGLVTALNGIRDELPFLWIGWLGEEIPSQDHQKVRQQLRKEFNCVPVFLTEELASKYYNDFSNDVLWPIFHYVPLTTFRTGSEKKFDFQLWEAYKLANQQFAQVVNSIYREGDYIWVHDYHLMVLPSLLRKRHPTCRIGWFLHTPFPSSEIYRILPVRKEILAGLLGADQLGFHTYDYARHFLSACSRILGINSTPKGLEWDHHFVSVGVFPIGVDPEYFEDILRNDSTKVRIAELAKKFENKKIIIGVDRLDYIKGMPHKLLAYERFLSRYPQWQTKVMLIQIGVPSRVDVQEYKHLAVHTNQLVGRINGKFGTLQHTPIHYINQSVSPQELLALYNIADICFITSIRDGMNLVSHEFAVCQNLPCSKRDGPGVLLLSEFAGSAQSLSGAVRVNPWNTDETANALHHALTLPLVERELRQVKLHRYVTTHTASFWAKSFLSDLYIASSSSRNVQKLLELPLKNVIRAYRHSKKRVIFIDYDGTLTELHSIPALAAPTPVIEKIISTITADKKNTVFVVSGRERGLLTSWLRSTNVGIAAESGFFIKMPHEDEWTSMGAEFDDQWRRVVRPIMQYFTERTPGSYIEVKESSLTWHYKETDPHFGTMQARDMQIHLEDYLCNLPLEVLQGSKAVEVRIQGISKAMVIEEVLKRLRMDDNENSVDFLLCVGDDQNEEDMFETVAEFQDFAKLNGSSDGNSGSLLKENASVYTCQIGTRRSEAKYYLENVLDLRRLLRSFANMSKDG